MKGPLNNQLETWSKTAPISMHVPGHKNATIGDLAYVNGKHDITEITGFDDLHHAEGVLKESMQMIQRHEDYDAFYLVNGTTSGILSVIHAFCNVPGDVIIARNVHKSVFNALDLGHQRASILPTEVDNDTLQYVKPKLHPSHLNCGKLAVLTYPNYYGQTFDIQSTIQHFHQQHIPVLVDEAHGAHFDIQGFPYSALNYGADYVVQSFHKTLPSLTMSSVLYIHKKAPQRDNVTHLLQTFQSSSPSYLLMASLESANCFYQSYQSDYFFEHRTKVIQALQEKHLSITQVDDPLKLLIHHPALSGYELQRLMEAEHIYVELADEKHVLWILPLWHEGDTFPMNALLHRIRQLNLPHSINHQLSMPNVLYKEEGVYMPDVFDRVRDVHYLDAEGTILAQHLIVYPPGIPTLLKGEKMNVSMIKLIDYWYKKGLRVEGLSEGKIKVKDD
ncbi:aminotransferase class V-fold PLP-dependent enzyme [Staphylococcus agnetis]|uniref:aminotransferase class V-fold PLP-dependent enzyme n=2 Tax=Staphylococcus agnetis TaxID=985762 RepID=UPI0004E2C27C|nr:aminotransferase class V-fold PLP-dependent enzyme [Staphylococcus agnetis]KFE40694.1 Orn Lys Arg decarboxylase family protein [Staphylococcus agnetis]NJH64118.1 aminotransferase class V-fold PLP-dependent enzyme [Staphylococcus agnetis]PTH44335.1 aminotransferase class V-fold PLP-dependent enzyme [Staphylococcus agnetis]PTH71607.1 aminotransferase class V-fold PLP-dependent enzyme [Staphylococcus agnetis]PTH71751.1 aminotransferase class V-fold PLP-dependent enzyme [Staphylococcus agnetis]